MHYMHLLLLTHESLISGLLRTAISIKPLQAHINKGLSQPEELQFLFLSCFCLCPSPMPSLLALPEPLVLLSPLPQLTGVAGWSSLCSAELPFPEYEPSLPFPSRLSFMQHHFSSPFCTGNLFATC